ncbi:MAG: GDSL-type esterase/lipase family protein, partial [Clostridia bacterium]|nr:GDSL-type esterase/lipase family protein [Clostridia bacterium]
MKRRILAFGDSNTWGWNPSNDLKGPPCRWDDDQRWTGVLQAELGDEFEVINEGLNGRTTVWEDPIEEYRCGKDQLPAVMDTAAPFELIIIMVGTNDLKIRFGVPPRDVAEGAGILVERALARKGAFCGQNPKVLLVCPPRLGPVSSTIMGPCFGGSEEKSALMDPYFQIVAQRLGVHYLNADQIVTSSTIDGLHLDLDQHEKLGKA